MESDADLQLILHVRNINEFLKGFLEATVEGLSPDARTHLEALIDTSNALLVALAAPSGGSRSLAQCELPSPSRLG
ncbi:MULTISPECIES: hypothetical protein [unclassified Haematobacter]|uniref:hypothetical protein n=1 Tax=unclassified Haematobacter TaxID=2640585 RepID=UPI0025C2AFE5|nr:MULTISPECIES: hypothetical protein [unclassified Haematobacter]